MWVSVAHELRLAARRALRALRYIRMARVRLVWDVWRGDAMYERGVSRRESRLMKRLHT